MKEEYAAGCTIPIFIVTFFVTGGIVGRYIDPNETITWDGGVGIPVSLVVAFGISALFFLVARKRDQ